MDLFVVGREVKECQESPLRMQGLSSPLSLYIYIFLPLSLTSQSLSHYLTTHTLSCPGVLLHMVYTHYVWLYACGEQTQQLRLAQKDLKPIKFTNSLGANKIKLLPEALGCVCVCVLNKDMKELVVRIGQEL